MVVLRRNFRRGGIGLDDCLSMNLDYDRQHNITIPSNCISKSPYEAPPLPALDNAVKIPSNINLNGTIGTHHFSQHDVHDLIAICLSIFFIGLVLVLLVCLICKCAAKRERKQFESFQNSNKDVDAEIDSQLDSPGSENMEKSRWISRVFRKGSQVSNDSAIELNDRTPISRDAAAPGRRTPSMASEFDSSSTRTLVNQSGGQSNRSSIITDLDVLEAVDITNLPLTYSQHPNSPYANPTLTPSQNSLNPNILTDNFTNRSAFTTSHSSPPPERPSSLRPYVTQPRTPQPSLSSYWGNRHADVNELDISENTTPVNHHERLCEDFDDDESLFARLSSSLEAKEMTASVVTLKMQRARKLDSRRSSTKLGSRSEGSGSPSSSTKVEGRA